MAEICERAFAETFRDDPTVYVLRQVVSHVAVPATRAIQETRVAEQWGAGLCASVVRVIANHDSGENLVRFENQSSFVCSFLSKFVTGSAWDCWYYGAFRVYRSLSTQDVILKVLETNRDRLGEILVQLQNSHALDALLETLGTAGQRELWGRVVRGNSQRGSQEAFGIFVHTAFRLMDRLSLWAGQRPSARSFSNSYLRTHPPVPDWTNSSSLADAVSGVLRALLHEGRIVQQNLDVQRLEAALDSSFDWLDKQHLKNAIVALGIDSPSFQRIASRTLRPVSLTPAQKRLLDSLAARIRDGSCALVTETSELRSNLFRLFAAVAEIDSSVHLSVLPILQSVVETWVLLRSSTIFPDQLKQLLQGEFDSLLASSSQSGGDILPHLHSLERSGEPALSLLEALVSSSPNPAEATALEVFDSTCAGLFLLARTVQDLRFSTILKDANFSRLEPLLCALARRIAGSAACDQHTPDPGAALWAGVSTEDFSPHIQRLQSLDQDRFLSALLDLIHAQRLIDSETPVVFPDEPFPSLVPVGLEALINFVASCLLRSWARWIPGLSASSVPFLLEKFIRRPGRIFLYQERIEIHLAPGPLDSILKMAGYLADSSSIPWMGNRFLRFRQS
jgi:hypothetical protein